MKLLSSEEKEDLIDQLNKQFGIIDIPQEILKFGEEKLRIFSGNISKEDLMVFDQNIRIENAGLYFAKFEKDGIRLTFDALAVFKNQIKKNIIDLSDEQAKEWLRGNEIYLKKDKGYKVLRYNNEFIGCGKSTGEKIANFMPKERRIKY